MQEVQQHKPEWSWSELSLVLTDDSGITELNQTYFNKSHPTDVISFCYPPMPGGDAGYTGEVIVNVQRAAEVGPEHEGSSNELALYIAHGCHHLTGASDHTPALRDAMRRQELVWLESAAEKNLSQDLIAPNPLDAGK